MKCRKRQKIVNRSNGEITFKCLNDRCAAQGHQVTDEVCGMCDKAVINSKPPCQKVLSDEEVENLIKNSGLPKEVIDQIPEYPTLPVQIWLYKEALKKWQRAGRPTRTTEEVEEIHRSHCSRCDWYDKGRCKGCGCKVTMGSVPIINKIKMATEHCPQELW